MPRNIYFLLFIVLWSSSGCKKHSHVNPLDTLPAETQRGLGTFGCLVNGKVFTPHGPSLGPILQCFYLNNTSTPGYFFNLNATDKSNFNDWGGIDIALDSIEITAPGIFKLTKAWTNGKGYGLFDLVLQTSTSPTQYVTTDVVTGELNIKKFDYEKRIVAGTFWFNAVSDQGDTVKITNGRFDMIFN